MISCVTDVSFRTSYAGVGSSCDTEAFVANAEGDNPIARKAAKPTAVALIGK